MWIELSIDEYYNRSGLRFDCMSDPLRTDGPSSIDTEQVPDRDAKIEQLLLAGLDHYFGARYEQAIAVWSRALFLDRNHARARAYIERARNALAERQRECEELLQKGLAAFHTGDGEEARRLLQAAMSMGAPPDEALAVLDRLSRLAPGQVTPSTAIAIPPDRETIQNPLPVAPGRGRMQALLAGGLVSILAVAVIFLAQGNPRSWRALLGVAPATLSVPVAASVDDPPPALPMRGETALARAQSLVATGHLHDALNALDLVRPTDAQRPDADRLRADIQRQLIALEATALADPSPPSGAGSLP
jgi:tetratricopeptide (TPR) repeat protein